MSGESPRAFLNRVCLDLLAHTGGTLGDDAALVAVQRLPDSVTHLPR